MIDESLDRQLRLAIANRRLIQFTYLGALRVAEPHDYGVHKNQLRLLVFQQRGSSSNGRAEVRGWRLLDVAKLLQCTVLDETFSGSRGHEHQNHYTWDVVYARVE
jgi:hypothetical protein